MFPRFRQKQEKAQKIAVELNSEKGHCELGKRNTHTKISSGKTTCKYKDALQALNGDICLIK